MNFWDKKSPALISAVFSGNHRRARFSYDDLLALFTFYQSVLLSRSSLLTLLRDLVIDARTGALPKVSFLVTRLQNPSILHHHA